MKEILNRHPRIHLFDEVHFFERLWDDRAHLGDLSAPISQAAAIHRVRDIVTRFGSDPGVAEVLTVEEYRRRLMAAGRQYRNLLRILLEEGARQKGAEIWGDSSPQDILYLKTILSWYPNARIVALVRDPRGFLSSYKNYYRRGVESYRERYNPIPISMLWRSYMTALLETEREPWAANVHRLRYESLVSDPEETVRALCAHVGVDFDPVMLDVDSSNSSFVPEGEPAKKRGIVASSQDRWKTELTPTELWMGERIFGEMRERLGYPPAVEDGQRLRPTVGGLARMALLLPGRVFNLLFRSHKPFTMAKFRRVMGLFRATR
ncbi:MAG: hypothetical protein DHS20C21_23440 [Gemmatimonadota bacterium]|nr:MAG: hypothetical protein DHS20C21_23440 [Gemmatimonadota bacterium]